MNQKKSSIAWYSPRPWHGMTFPVWTRMLKENHWDIAVSRLPMASAITILTVFNSYSRWLSEWAWRRRAEETSLARAPLFVLGHWRTGTTLLHELLIRDPQFTFPNTFHCMVPHHFLRTQRVLPRVSKWFLPRQRVMDNMEFGWEHPQEDEFALCNLGVPSPYLYWAFPGSREKYDKYLTLEDLGVAEREAWKATFLWFLRRLTLHDSRRLVLKSPPHTARLPVLTEMFPDAKFIHLTRDPRTVVPSTVRTWKRMRDACGLQFRQPDDLQPYVLDTFQRMYGSYWRNSPRLAPNQLVEVSYEQLVEDPMGEVERVYAQLELGRLDAARGRMKRYLRQVRDYRTNAFQLDPDEQRQIEDHCATYMEKYGYAAETRARTQPDYSHSSSSSSSSKSSPSSSSSSTSSSSNSSSSHSSSSSSS